MRKCFIALMASFLIIFVCIAGCSSNASTAYTTPQPVPENAISTTEPSEMALQLAEIPGIFTSTERAERAASDVSQTAHNYGWINGYTVSFQNINIDPLSAIVISQGISVYPKANVTKLLPVMKAHYVKVANESISVDELPDPGIGDFSQAFRITYKENNLKVYVIDFVKNDVYEQLSMQGTTTDYETLKNLGKIAAAKIK